MFGTQFSLLANRHKEVRDRNGDMKDAVLIPKLGTFKYEWGSLQSSIFYQEI